MGAADEPRPIKPLSEAQFRRIEPPVESTEIPIIIDVNGKLSKGKPQVTQLEAKPKSIEKATKKNTITLTASGGIKGLASYYCGRGSPCPRGFGPDFNGAAAGPVLRIAMGGAAAATAKQPWRGKKVTVCGSAGCARVTLVDWCQCYYRRPNEKLIDLFANVFYRIGASRGKVTVSW